MSRRYCGVTRPGRSSSTTSPLVTAGDLIIDPSAHTVTFQTRKLELSPREFDLLYTLARSAGQVIATEDLINVFGVPSLSDSRKWYMFICAG